MADALTYVLSAGSWVCNLWPEKRFIADNLVNTKILTQCFRSR
jgi:hypothetical protein